MSPLIRPGPAQSSIALASPVALDRVPNLAAGHEANLTIELRLLDDEQDHVLAAVRGTLLVDLPKSFPASKSLPLGEALFTLRHSEAASRLGVGGWHPVIRGPRTRSFGRGRGGCWTPRCGATRQIQ